ncbi:MAG: endonuclease domain-containing protein [Armatimonadetes bacterium]|nr:endonuclease domain-containing protein [Armatimonadota bacterium]
MFSKKRIRGTTPELEKRARELRRQMTPAEERLWAYLRGGRLKGFHFRRQHPVGHYILDFYCAICKLAIEVDGEIHEYQQAEDQARTGELMKYGYTVLRFKNQEVINDIKSVITKIEEVAIELRSHRPPTQPPPKLGEEQEGIGGKGGTVQKKHRFS